MPKKIQVLGIELDNYTVREAMLLLEEYVSTEGLNVVEVVSTELLMAAAQQEELKSMLDETDLQIIGDSTILEVLEEKYEQQNNELQKRDLEEQFLRSLIRKKKTVYWMGASESALQDFNGYMSQYYPELQVVGTFAGKIEEESIDAVVNDVNSAASDVILMSLPSPLQERFVFENRNRFNARLCVCMGTGLNSKYPSRTRISRLKALIDQTMFKRKVLKHSEE